MENKSLLLSVWKYLVRVPRPVWQGEVNRNAKNGRSRLGFMSPDHHRVRDYVVRELPRLGAAIPPERIAQDLGLSAERTAQILDELEKGMTFLFRNERGAVSWAYPVTVDPTPHRITFSTGEQVYAA